MTIVANKAVYPFDLSDRPAGSLNICLESPLPIRYARFSSLFAGLQTIKCSKTKLAGENDYDDKPNHYFRNDRDCNWPNRFGCGPGARRRGRIGRVRARQPAFRTETISTGSHGVYTRD